MKLKPIYLVLVFITLSCSHPKEGNSDNTTVRLEKSIETSCVQPGSKITNRDGVYWIGNAGTGITCGRNTLGQEVLCVCENNNPDLVPQCLQTSRGYQCANCFDKKYLCNNSSQPPTTNACDYSCMEKDTALTNLANETSGGNHLFAQACQLTNQDGWTNLDVLLNESPECAAFKNSLCPAVACATEEGGQEPQPSSCAATTENASNPKFKACLNKLLSKSCSSEQSDFLEKCRQQVLDNRGNCPKTGPTAQCLAYYLSHNLSHPTCTALVDPNEAIKRLKFLYFQFDSLIPDCLKKLIDQKILEEGSRRVGDWIKVLLK